MASIGGIACSYIKGGLPQLGNRFEKWSLAGIDGYGFLLTGAGQSEGQVACILRSTNTGCELWYALLKAMEGSIVLLANDWGDTRYVFVEEVSQPQKAAIFRPGSVAVCRMEVAVKLTVLQ